MMKPKRVFRDKESIAHFKYFTALPPHPRLHLFSFLSFYLDFVVTDADRVFDTENARFIIDVLPNWRRFTNNVLPASICFFFI